MSGITCLCSTVIIDHTGSAFSWMSDRSGWCAHLNSYRFPTASQVFVHSFVWTFCHSKNRRDSLWSMAFVYMSSSFNPHKGMAYSLFHTPDCPGLVSRIWCCGIIHYPCDCWQTYNVIFKCFERCCATSTPMKLWNGGRARSLSVGSSSSPQSGLLLCLLLLGDLSAEPSWYWMEEQDVPVVQSSL